MTASLTLIKTFADRWKKEWNGKQRREMKHHYVSFVSHGKNSWIITTYGIIQEYEGKL